jgi:hypothetical protein
MKSVFPAICGLILLCSTPAGAIPLEELVSPATAAVLERGETITEVQLKNPAPKLRVRNSYLEFLTNTLMADVQPTVMVESLALYRKPAGAGTAGWTEAERSALYNRALTLGSLAGLQYYSVSHRSMRTFYEISQVIDGPDSRQPQADPVYAVPPEYLVLFARQKDLSFGDNVYRYEYYARNDAIILVQENITPMNISIIPAIKQNNLRTVTAVIDSGPYLLLYTVALVKAASLPGLGGRIGDSFSNRLEAVRGWFVQHADQAFGAAE